MFERVLSKTLLKAVKKYPVLTLTGPRQSGKTTLVRNLFQNMDYVSLEDPDERQYALNDARGFLSKYNKGVIVDEAQKVPELFSYIQTLVDETKKNGQFILTGSHNFLLMERISQSLAGRAAVRHLLPMSFEELRLTKKCPKTMADFLIKGFYPRIYDQDLDPGEWYADYINTYIERDVRTIKNIGDLNIFQKFIKLCAGRNGQILNLSNLGNDCGVSYNTVKSWISLLETSFIVFLLPPFYKNYNKRIIKSPKLYFFDPGLVCYLLGIQDKQMLDVNPLKGQIFEGLIVSEIAKFFYHRGKRPNIYYWRDKTGHEIDCIVESGTNLLPIEIKVSETVNSDFFNNINFWQKISSSENGLLVYSGDRTQIRKNCKVIPWQKLVGLL